LSAGESQIIFFVSRKQLRDLVGGSSVRSPKSALHAPVPSNTMCHWTPQVYLPNGI